MTEAVKKNKSRSVDMTSGSIIGCIVTFAIPLLLGNLFQQLYNMVDTWVIGQTGNVAAYSAVGSVGPVVNIFIGLFSGFASGASVVISQYFGAKDEKKVSEAAHTAALITVILSVVFTVIGLSCAGLLLDLMLGKQESSAIYSAAFTYLMIYFSGITAMLVYNMGAGILRAVGDSRRPFYFLAVAAVTNTVLDLLFVYYFGWGVAGVALATVIAQVFSAVLTVIALFKTKSSVRLSFKNMKINGEILLKIIKIGTPAGIQMALTAFSNVFVQSYIAGVNSEAEYSLGGWTTYGKVDQLVFLPIQSIGLAVTTFVGQNVGKGDMTRAKKGTYTAFWLSVVSAIVLMLPIIIFARGISWFFNHDEGVITHSAMLLQYMTPFYLFCCVNQIFSSAMRGAGSSTPPMIFMLTGFIAVRQIYLYVMANFISNEFLPIAFSYPVGWMFCAILTLGYFFLFFRFEKSKKANIQPKTEEKA